MPIQIPCIVNVFHNAIFRIYKIPFAELELNETQSSIIDNNNNKTYWSANLTFNGLDYSVPFNYSSKKIAKFALIDKVLQQIDPITHNNFLIKKNETIKKLNEMRRNVLISNNNNNFESVIIEDIELFSEVEDFDDDNNNKNNNDDNNNEDLSLTNSVTDDEYLLYVSDNDVELYLKGILLLLFYYIIINYYITNNYTNYNFVVVIKVYYG